MDGVIVFPAISMLRSKTNIFVQSALIDRRKRSFSNIYKSGQTWMVNSDVTSVNGRSR